MILIFDATDREVVQAYRRNEMHRDSSPQGVDGSFWHVPDHPLRQSSSIRATGSYWAIPDPKAAFRVRLPRAANPLGRSRTAAQVAPKHGRRSRRYSDVSLAYVICHFFDFIDSVMADASQSFHSLGRLWSYKSPARMMSVRLLAFQPRRRRLARRRPRTRPAMHSTSAAVASSRPNVSQRRDCRFAIMLQFVSL